jgi:hypothetical protein
VPAAAAAAELEPAEHESGKEASHEAGGGYHG